MRLSIRKKMLGMFLLLSILFGIVSGISYLQFITVKQSYSELLNRQSTILMYAQDMQGLVAQQNGSIQGYLLNRESMDLGTLNATSKLIMERIEELGQLMDTPEQKERIGVLTRLNQEYSTKLDTVVSLAREKKITEAIEVNKTDASALGRSIRVMANTIAEDQRQLMEAAKADVDKRVSLTASFVLWISIATVVLSIVIGPLFARTISKPILIITNKAKQIAAGDLTVDDITLKNRDETGDLAASFNQMKANLRELLAQVNASSEQVAASAEELMASTEQVTLATNQVAVTIQEMASEAMTAAQVGDESAKGMEEVAAGFEHIAQSTSIVSKRRSIQQEKPSMETRQFWARSSK